MYDCSFASTTTASIRPTVLSSMFKSMAQHIVHVEILQKSESTADHQEIVNAVQKCNMSAMSSQSKISEYPFLSRNIISISTSEDGEDRKGCDCQYRYHVYRLYDIEPAEERLDDDSDGLAAATHWTLPCRDFQGLWESLMFDTDIKGRMLKYVKTIMHYAERGVNPNIISCNRVVLLHGPPGTGKTTLCKALAQKVAIHLSERFHQGSLLEINSHSLFSKWFSESGNLVMKMFAKIEELLQDTDTFVCILIDEVESLTAARAAHNSGTEPSDAIRVVNALLTQLDRIKKHPNVIIMTTSNVTEKVDLAFVDRADIRQYIGPPSTRAIYEILRSCITELMRSDIIQPDVNIAPLDINFAATTHASAYCKQLHGISGRCCGMSGRTLRKIPFIAHACFIEVVPCTTDEFLDALARAVDMKSQEMKELKLDGE